MPDSLQPPNWDPAPFDERDLDTVLSGETADIPDALRPVADTLAALRAAPTRAEFSGEANIMAEFRALAEFQALGLREAQHSAGPADTLELPALPAGHGRRRAARHRTRRHVPPVSWRTGSLMGVAAAAVIVIAVAFFGNLPGPILRITGHASTPSPPSLQGAGSKDSKTGNAKPSGSHPASAPSPMWSPSPTPSTSPSPSELLCRSYLAGLRHPESEAEVSLRNKLATLAGGADPGQVSLFCIQQLGHGRHYPGTDHESRANLGQDSQSQSGGTGQAAQGQQPGSGASPTATQSGTGASQSTQSAPGPSQGSQDGGPTPNPPSPVSSPAQ